MCLRANLGTMKKRMLALSKDWIILDGPRSILIHIYILFTMITDAVILFSLNIRRSVWIDKNISYALNI